VNQDQLKEKLESLMPNVPEFTVVFTGKKSKKVDGLYYPDRKEIIIHNRNHTNENAIVYTGIHEFAHHVHFSSANRPTSTRSHTGEFWGIFHALLRKAEEEGVYENVFTNEKDFVNMTAEIKSKFIGENGKIMKEMGGLLMRAMELCKKHDVPFEDYLERTLAVPKATAQVAVRSFAENITPVHGFDTMKLLANIRKGPDRQAAETAIAKGESFHTIKSLVAGKPPEPVVGKGKVDKAEVLVSEKKRIQKKIEELKERMAEIDRQIAAMKK
jgi:hypothetical protein